MRKTLLLLLIPFVLFSATRTWNSGSSTDMNDGANYNPTGAIDVGDDLVFDATSAVNATATADLTVGSVTTTAAYSGVWSLGTYLLTCAGNVSIDGTGAPNLGGGITVNGASSNIHIGSGVGTVTATASVLTLNTATGGVYDIDKSNVLVGGGLYSGRMQRRS